VLSFPCFLSLLAMSFFWGINVHTSWCFLLGFLHNGCEASSCHIRQSDFVHVEDFYRLRWLLFSSPRQWWFSGGLARFSLFGWCHGGKYVIHQDSWPLQPLQSSLTSSYALSLRAFPDFTINFLLQHAFFLSGLCGACRRCYRDFVVIEPTILIYFPFVSLVISSWHNYCGVLSVICGIQF
jgi:hypothetical protein